MAPTRKEIGKAKIGENASNQALDSHDFETLEPTLKERRFHFNFKNYPLNPHKHGNLASFPSLSFDFLALFHHQGLDSLIADSKSIYPDLVRVFYANLSITKGYVFTSHVKGKDIVLTLEEFGKCLDIPYEGERILHGFTQDWPGYSKVNYYFSISRFTEQEIINKRVCNSSSNRFIFSSKNLSVSDRMLHFHCLYPHAKTL